MTTKELSEQEIKRFTPALDLQHGNVCLRPNPKGGAVLYEDHESTVTDLRAEIASQQAKIDALMLEFCPDRMTSEQKEAWAKHQKPIQISKEWCEKMVKLEEGIEDFAAGSAKIDETDPYLNWIEQRRLEQRRQGFNNEGDPIGGDCGGDQEEKEDGQARAQLERGGK